MINDLVALRVLRMGEDHPVHHPSRNALEGVEGP